MGFLPPPFGRGPPCASLSATAKLGERERRAKYRVPQLPIHMDAIFDELLSPVSEHSQRARVWRTLCTVG